MVKVQPLSREECENYLNTVRVDAKTRYDSKTLFQKLIIWCTRLIKIIELKYGQMGWGPDKVAKRVFEALKDPESPIDSLTLSYLVDEEIRRLGHHLDSNDSTVLERHIRYLKEAELFTREKRAFQEAAITLVQKRHLVLMRHMQAPAVEAKLSAKEAKLAADEVDNPHKLVCAEKLPTPTMRHENRLPRAIMPNIDSSHPSVRDIQDSIGGASCYPDFGKVLYIAHILDNLPFEQNESLFQELDLWVQLFLLEQMPKQFELLVPQFVDKYFGLPNHPKEENGAYSQKVVKLYLLKHQKNENVNGTYGKILTEINSRLYHS